MIPALLPLEISAFVVVLLVVLAIIVLLGLGAVGMYNGLVQLKNRVEESWNQVDVELQRRHDLIPNLVNTVKGIAGHERNTLEEVVRLRNQAAGMQSAGLPTQERAQVEEQLTQAVHQLLVTVEAYPDLKASANFSELQKSLSETEDRIAAGRRYYNANVRAYNTKIESFPTNVLAGMFRFTKANYFEVTNAEVRRAQDVDFSDIASVGPTASQRAAEAEQPAIGAPQYQQAYPNPGTNTADSQATPFGQPGYQTSDAGQASAPGGQPFQQHPQAAPGGAMPANEGQPPAPSEPETDPYGNPRS